jgi:fructosamine-3-kinase
MEFVEGTSSFSRGAERHAAELLAALHGVTAGGYGHERDTLIGSLDQPNPRTASWAGFFREHRLLYAARVARERGRLPEELFRRVGSSPGSWTTSSGSRPRPPSSTAIAWSANVLAQGDRVMAFLDPAIYHADPEIELSYISLFNSFGDSFFEHYAELRRSGPASSRSGVTFTPSIHYSSTSITSAALTWTAWTRRCVGFGA